MALHEAATRVAHVWPCAAVTMLACAYLASVAWKGWIPFDDGMLAQTAQRVLEGQLPHRDFSDVYTGGLSFFHAAAFQIAGSSLGTLRATLLVVATVSIPAWYYVASRFTAPLMAALITLAGFAWSIPNYPAAMPSWYNLILAIAAAAAMLRYLDTRRRRWIFVAGLCAGLSVLVKIIGLYLIAALASFLAYSMTESPRAESESTASPGRAGTLALVVIVAGLTSAPFVLVRSVLDIRAVMELALPPALLAGAVLGQVARRVQHGGRPSLRSLVNTYAPLALGIAIPLVAFTLVFWRAGALGELVRGVFVLPQRRFADPTMHTAGGPPLTSYVFTLPIILALTVRPRVAFDVRGSVLLLVACAGVVLVSVYDHRMMVAVWLSLRMLTLPIAIIFALRLVSAGAERAHSTRRNAMVLVCSIAVWCSLTQFPYGAPIYFSYVAPLVILAVIALAVESGRPTPTIGVPLVLGYAAFAVAARPQLFPRRPELSPAAERIDLPRGGIYVWPAEQRQYTAIDSVLRQHSDSPAILALPDVPEVYFLAGYENPTRAIYDIFEDTTGRSARLLKLVDDRRIQTVVINRDPQVSPPIDKSLNDSLIRRFPESQTIGGFEVRWK